MGAEVFAFYLFAISTITGGLFTVLSRNPVHSVLWLILSFLSSAGLFILLGAEFVAMLLIIVYVGAVAVLFLFVVMMLDVDFASLKADLSKYLPLGLLIMVILLMELAMGLAVWVPADGAEAVRGAPTPSDTHNTAALGLLLYDKYILLFPFCSPHLTSKKWPYYNELIAMINEKSDNKFKVVIAPGPGEIKDASSINALCVLDNGKALDISQLAALIKDSSFVVANDTGPAHMTAHLGSKGIALFGSHTTPFKVSIERENFKAIQAPELSKLSPEKVFERLSEIIS